jgi:hypothetical protein
MKQLSKQFILTLLEVLAEVGRVRDVFAEARTATGERHRVLPFGQSDDEVAETLALAFERRESLVGVLGDCDVLTASSCVSGVIGTCVTRSATARGTSIAYVPASRLYAKTSSSAYDASDVCTSSYSVVLKIRYCQLEQIERREFTYRREGKCRFPMPDEYTGTVVVSARICWLIRIDAYGNSLVPSATQKLLYVLGNAVRVRMWYREFREFEVLCLAYNIKRNIAH